MHIVWKWLAISALLPSMIGCAPKTVEVGCSGVSFPSPSELLNIADLSALKYSKENPYNPLTGEWYETWTDAKFEFTSALYFHYRAKRTATGYDVDQTCLSGLSFETKVPMGAAGERMLTAFLKTTANSLRVPVEKFIGPAMKVSEVHETLSTGDNGAGVKLSIVPFSHPNRGDFVVVRFDGNSVAPLGSK